MRRHLDWFIEVYDQWKEVACRTKQVNVSGKASTPRRDWRDKGNLAMSCAQDGFVLMRLLWGRRFGGREKVGIVMLTGGEVV